MVSQVEMENPWLKLPPCPPYVLPDDREQFEAFNGKLRPHEAAFRIDRRLIPVAFMGNPEAGLVVLTRNPKFVEEELRAETDPAYVAALRGNIQGRPEAQAAIGLLERFRDTSAGIYWRRVFKEVLERVESSDPLARRVLIVQFLPYFSREWSTRFSRRIGPFPSQHYGFELVRAAARRGATIVCTSGSPWPSAVAELQGANVVPGRNLYTPP